MLKLVVCVTILAEICSAQEHLTCLRTDSVLTQQSSQTPQRALQGSPGKQGPRGQIGLRGYPGQKGEPGIPDNRKLNVLQGQINLLSQKLEILQNQSKTNELEKQINSLVQEVEVLKNQSRENRRFLDVFTRRLHIPPYFYVYQLTPGRQSWQESRQYCQNWGGDLAVHGVKTMQNRKKLIETLSINRWTWIGANDIVSQGNWTWVNGEHASSSELIWESGQPDGGDSHNCVFMYGRNQGSIAGLAHDYACTHLDKGLCETRI